MVGSLQVVFLALLQGATEFLPISSSAHLVVLPRFFSWPEIGLPLEVALHFGTLLAVLWYFRVELISMTRAVFYDRGSSEAHRGRVLIISAFPSFVFGYFFQNIIERYFQMSAVVAAHLIFWGMVLWLADYISVHRRTSKALQAFGYQEGFIAGSAQCLALMPGVSRSGITLTSLLFLGFTRKDAARLAFLMSVPVIFGASFYTFSQLLVFPPPLVILKDMVLGVFVSAFSGFFIIKYFLRYLEHHSLWPFVLYRVILGIVLLFVF